MFKKIVALFAFISVIGCKNFGKLTLEGNLTRSLAEASGIATFQGDSLIYAIADHGNPNHIYGIDSTGYITREIIVKNAPNKDWEDLATNRKGTLYISDTGNNDNDRKKQFIYILDDFTNSIDEIDTITARKITFTLSDQKKYPPDLKDWNFDIEALAYKDEYLFLFTRNRSRAFDGITKLYKLPALEGTFEAQLLDTYYVCDDLSTCAITAADIAPDGKTLVLLTSDKLITFTDFQGDQFFSGKVKSLPFDNKSQKEGVAFKNDSIVYIVDERRAQTGGNLYTFKID